MKKRTHLKIARVVTFALVLREIKGKFGANRLGAFWFIFEPLAHIVVLISIYSIVRANNNYGVDLPIFLISGVIPFLLFKNIALKGMEAVSANRALFSYRQIKPFDTIVARTIVECALMACIYLVVIFALGFWGGYDVAISRPLEWLVYLIVGVVLSFGLALIFCIIGEAAPETKTFIRLAYMPLYFISGVIVPLWLIPGHFLNVLMWNPYLHIIEGMRENTFAVYPKIQGISVQYSASVAVLILFAGVALYRARRLKLVAT